MEDLHHTMRMRRLKNIICSQGLPIEDSEDKYYISLFEDYGNLSTDGDKLIGGGCGSFDETDTMFTLQDVDGDLYFMLDNKYMSYDPEEDCIRFVKDVPKESQRLEFQQEDINHRSIMTMTIYEDINEPVRIEWVTSSYGSIGTNNEGNIMRFQLVRYNGSDNKNDDTEAAS